MSQRADVPACVYREACIALERLSELPALAGEGGAVSLLPDDRTTRGDWYLGYGAESWLLCAQNYLVDREGGAGPRLKVRFSTTDPKEPSRLWVSAPSTEDPAALWDPVRLCRVPANRDDRGERAPIGTGPDLVLRCTIPAGDHILSLYFVNDHHYYEPNRRYTVEIHAGDGAPVVADVRDFGGGVYKRFRVTGPVEPVIRIRRDASMNVLLQGIFLDRFPDRHSFPAGRESLSFRNASETGRTLTSGWTPNPPETVPADRGDSLVGILRLLKAGGCHRESLELLEQASAQLTAQHLRPVIEAVSICARENAWWREKETPVGMHPLDPLWRHRLESEPGLSANELRELVTSDSASVTPYARCVATDRLLVSTDGKRVELGARSVIAGARVLAENRSGEHAVKLLRTGLAERKLSAWDEFVMRNGLAALAADGKLSPDEALANLERLAALSRDRGESFRIAGAARNTAEALKRGGRDSDAAKVLEQHGQGGPERTDRK